VDNLNGILTPEVVQKYTVTVPISEDWVAYRNPRYSPTSPSLKESRFNRDGQAAFYVAKGKDVARQEIPNYSNYQLYRMRAGDYTAWDLPRFAADYGCTEEFLQSKEGGGYGICQEVAEIVTAVNPDVSGVVYSSYAMNEAGASGNCLAVLPPSGVLLDSSYFVPMPDEPITPVDQSSR